jgi:hypothetical protein
VCDEGEHATDDYISVRVLSGPYAGYQNSGVLLGGNIQVTG